ncbi:hypothetical protein ACN261_11930 [Micromonospora sp. WMMD723]|uniref:hypothetical protein n=1 Tax=unclassified Micromonospora TaxID=2617518 RepID=UPI003B9282D9
MELVQSAVGGGEAEVEAFPDGLLPGQDERAEPVEELFHPVVEDVRGDGEDHLHPGVALDVPDDVE